MAQAQEVLSYWDLAKALTDIPAAIRWCRDRKLLATEMACEACGRECREVKRPQYPDGVCWRCPRKGCQKEYSLRNNSYFSNSKLSLSLSLTVSLSLVRDTSSTSTILETSSGSEMPAPLSGWCTWDLIVLHQVAQILI